MGGGSDNYNQRGMLGQKNSHQNISSSVSKTSSFHFLHHWNIGRWPPVYLVKNKDIKEN